jgi:3-oxoacyl-[acyl-carrier-protein] synthase II
MTYRDQAGRPVVVVTGLGVVTSLGTGKADNWRKLTAGASGIHAITRFPTDALKTRIAGTVDHPGRSDRCAVDLAAAGRDRRHRGGRRIRH